MRKLIITVASLLALAIPAAGIASVAVDANGVGSVSKGDVQSALKWNNAAFDKGAGSLKFTASGEKVVVDYPMTCFDLNSGSIVSGGHRLIVQPGDATIQATAVLNGNGKQITGFNLTGKSTDFTNVGPRVLRDTGCPEGAVMFMNEGTPTQPNTVSIAGGLKVNGVALPNSVA